MNSAEILNLLKIMDLAKEWPELRGLHDAARAELVEANAEALRAALARSKKEAEVKARADAELAAKHRVDAERKQKEDEAAAKASAAAAEKARAEQIHANETPRESTLHVPKYGDPDYDTSHLSPSQRAEYHKLYGKSSPGPSLIDEPLVPQEVERRGE